VRKELTDFEFCDLTGYLLARQMLPSDVKRLRRLLAGYSSNVIAGLDTGLSRPSNIPPRNSLLLKEAYSDRETLPGKRPNELVDTHRSFHSTSLDRRGALQ